MSGCTSLFYDQNQSNTLHSRISLSDTQISRAIKAKDELLNFVKPMLSEIFDYPVRHWIQGSWKNHTLIRPASKFEEFDVDIGLYIIGEEDIDNIDAAELKADLRQANEEFCKFHNGAKVPKEVKDRCERVIFPEHFHIDLPLYYYNTTNEKILLATENGWEDSDPKGFQDWFEKTVPQEKRAVTRRIIRYLKSWAALAASGATAKPLPSMALTILAAEFQENLTHNDDEMDFSLAAGLIANHLLESGNVITPLSDKDILGFSESDWIFWRPHLHKLEYISGATKECNTPIDSYYLWEKLFGHMLPPINETSTHRGGTGLPAITRPAEIEVTHYDSKNNVISKKITDSVISYKDESLCFRVTNTNSYPATASITWIVRNQGGEAADSNDLGHNTPLEMNESINRDCAYSGIHYMDATISHQGMVLGTGKVKVNIQPYVRPNRNPVRRRIFKGK